MAAAVLALFLAAEFPDAAYGQSSSSGARKQSSRSSRSRKQQNQPDPDDNKPCPNPWPEKTEAQQAKALTRQKELLESLPAKLSLPAFPYKETDHFLFATDLPPAYVSPVLVALDSMYKELCKAFRLDENSNIWLGKATIIAFARRDTFRFFEQTCFKGEPPYNVQGLAHLARNGEVIISCYHGEVPSFFRVVIVHETTHGFMHRYRGPADIPSWINEGAADWIAGKSVPIDHSVANRQRSALAMIRMTRSLGGDFFTAEQLTVNQYGIASSITDFLLNYNFKAYRKLIDGIKDGKDWQQSLKDSYGLSPEELAFRYGMTFAGVPVRP
jgi:hypothetical protein